MILMMGGFQINILHLFIQLDLVILDIVGTYILVPHEHAWCLKVTSEEKTALGEPGQSILLAPES